MDLRQLNHFLAVAEELHFGRAAERLGMTQPPLSQSIMGLERELGAPLFTRTKRQVALTPFGAQWLEHVRPALGAVRDLSAIAQSLRAGRAGRLALSFVSSADYSILPALVRGYVTAFPDVDLALLEATSDVQVEALIQGRIDAGLLIPPAAGLPAAIEYRPLLRESRVAAVPERWVEDGRLTLCDGQLDGKEWMNEPLIIFPRQTSPTFHDLVIAYYRKNGCLPYIRQRAIQMQTIISLVSAEMGIALVPASLRNLMRTGVRYLSLADPTSELETGLAWRAADESATLQQFVSTASVIAQSWYVR